MKKTFVVSIVMIAMALTVIYASAGRHTEGMDNRQLPSKVFNIESNFGKIPLYFIPNKGQVNPKALFYADTRKYTLWMTDEGLVFDRLLGTTPGAKPTYREVTRLYFLKANKKPEILPVEMTEHVVSYFKGKDPSQWKTGIVTSKAVLYKELYKNIDLKVYGIESRIEYDWVVKLGGDPSRIGFKYQNIKKAEIDQKGNFVIHTDFGQLVHQRPVGYQDIEGKRIPVEVSFKKAGKNGCSFIVGSYNKAYTLVIDPVVVAYSTYLGGTTGGTKMEKIAVDASGNAYILGITVATDFPVRNQYIIINSGGGALHGGQDLTVTKMNAAGTSLTYSSYVGGESDEYVGDIAVDGSGRAYITGSTWSDDYPVRTDTQRHYEFENQGLRDSVLSRFSASGTSLDYSGYFGGDGEDSAYGIAVDSSQNAYICGTTNSSDFPVLNQYQGYAADVQSGYVIKFNTAVGMNNTLVYSTYIRGTSDTEYSLCSDIVVSTGTAYVTGETDASDFPTVGAFQNTSGGGLDAFLFQLSTDGSNLLYSTYLGGSSDDAAWGIVLNGTNPIITGRTVSSDFPTQSPYQAANAGALEAFVTSFSADGSTLVYSTYLGGTGDDGASGLTVVSGEVVLTGLTDSTDFPVFDSLQALYGGGDSDAFITRLEADGSGLVASSFLGGNYADSGECIASLADAIYVAGYTRSSDFLLYNPYQSEGIAGYNGFITKLSSFSGGSPFITVTSPGGGEVWASGSDHTITWAASSAVGDVLIEYSLDNGTTWDTIANSTTNDGRYDWTLPTVNSDQCLVRISEASDLDPTDVSGTFTIFEGLAIVSPNGNENWEVGSQHLINWSSTGAVGNVNLDLSTDNGSSWTAIAVSVTNNGNYLWTVPDSVSSQCLVRVSEALDGEPVDESNNTFSIIAAGTDSLTLTYPNGGETLTGGSTVNITWTKTGTGVANVTLEYSTNNGSTWNTIADVTPNDGSYAWVVPSTPSTQCLVRISDAIDGDPVNQSNEVFTIEASTAYPKITVTSPNGGETYMVGFPMTITWSSEGDIPNVRIAFSSNNGGSWIEAAASEVNDGSFAWTAPNTPSTQCKVRVSDASDGSPSDASNNVFTIVTPPPSLSITSPIGKEYWQVGSVHDITWISYQQVGDVKIEYSIDNKATWMTIVASTANDGVYSWKVPNKPSSTCFVRISEAADGSPSSTSPNAFTITTGAVVPEISVNRTALYYGALKSSKAVTPPQKIMVTNSGVGTLRWRISTLKNESWMSYDTSDGAGKGVITFTVSGWALTPGVYEETIIITNKDDEEQSVEIPVTLTVYPALSDSAPFGSFDSPVNGSTVMSSVPVTGWALDDVAVERVSIWRGGTAAEGGGKIYIGDAVLVEGARTDVEPFYPTYPQNYKAGWGYMMLTNFLPNGGNGTFTLYAYAHDGGNHEVLLGTKTITCDNAHAVKPFGAIDTPAQGGEASGKKYRNNGWALTPMPNKIPTSGSTIMAYIDGVAIGNPAYGFVREDVAALFPGYANSSGPHGYLYFDTSVYDNGVHTISWVATDNAGNTDGIGSRYFITVANTGYGSTAGRSGKEADRPEFQLSSDYKSFRQLSQLDGIRVDNEQKIGLMTGYRNTLSAPVPETGGRIVVKMEEDGRMELHLSSGSEISRCTGYMVTGDRLMVLPIGSTLDGKKGIFYWQAGPGFLGKYQFIFVIEDINGKLTKRPVFVTIDPKYNK